MTYQEFLINYNEVNKQMQDYFKIRSDFKGKIYIIMQKKYKELKISLNDFEIFELHRTIYELESNKNKNNETLENEEIIQIINNRINRINKTNIEYSNNNYYSKHKLYKIRSLKINNRNINN